MQKNWILIVGIIWGVALECWGRGHELTFSGSYGLIKERSGTFNLWSEYAGISDPSTHETDPKGLVVDYKYEFRRFLGFKLGFGTWKTGSKDHQLSFPFSSNEDFATAKTVLKGRHLDVGAYFFYRSGRWKPFIGAGLVWIRIELNTDYDMSNFAESVYNYQDAKLRARGASWGKKLYAGFGYEFGPQWGLNFEVGRMENTVGSFELVQTFAPDRTGIGTQPEGSKLRKYNGLYSIDQAKEVGFKTDVTYLNVGLNFRF